MPPFFHSVPWVHLVPAFFAVIVSFLYLKTKLRYLKVVWAILWLLFVPNTAYIFTDVVRIGLHWNASNTVMHAVLLVQYIILEIIGLITFLLGLLPCESIIRAWDFSRKKQILAIVLLNFFIGFGMVLGRTGYTNSYVVVTQPIKVFNAVMNIFTSFYNLELVVLFGILCNSIYFLFRNILLSHTKKLL